MKKYRRLEKIYNDNLEIDESRYRIVDVWEMKRDLVEAAEARDMQEFNRRFNEYTARVFLETGQWSDWTSADVYFKPYGYYYWVAFYMTGEVQIRKYN